MDTDGVHPILSSFKPALLGNQGNMISAQRDRLALGWTVCAIDWFASLS